MYTDQMLEQLANQRIAELRAAANTPLLPELPRMRRRVARTLRRLADWLEPALKGSVGVRIPAPRHPG